MAKRWWLSHEIFDIYQVFPVNSKLVKRCKGKKYVQVTITEVKNRKGKK